MRKGFTCPCLQPRTLNPCTAAGSKQPTPGGSWTGGDFWGASPSKQGVSRVTGGSGLHAPCQEVVVSKKKKKASFQCIQAYIIPSSWQWGGRGWSHQRAATFVFQGPDPADPAGFMQGKLPRKLGFGWFVLVWIRKEKMLSSGQEVTHQDPGAGPSTRPQPGKTQPRESSTSSGEGRKRAKAKQTQPRAFGGEKQHCSPPPRVWSHSSGSIHGL